MFDIRHGDCREVLKQLPDCSVDSIVTDPPYELGFMGKAWDSTSIAYRVEGAAIPERDNRPFLPSKNNHPTVKPTDLMRYLCRLVTPPNGTVLDPFTGSGSTGKAATLEGFNFIGIEQSAEYDEIATARIRHAEQQ